jgi:hypothetical protein
MVTWITEDGRWARPVYDLAPPDDWASTPEPDGSWKTWRGVRYHVPVMRFEGTPEEIAAEVRALRETCPYRPSYLAAEPPLSSVEIGFVRWYRTPDPSRVALWLGFAVRPNPEGDALRPFDEIVLEEYADRLAKAGKHPLTEEPEPPTQG